MVAVGAAFLPFLLLVMGIEILLGIIYMTLSNLVEPRLVKEEGPLIMSRKFIDLGHRQRIDRTGFDAVSTKHAFGNIDIKFSGIALERESLIFFAKDFNAASRTSSFA